MHICFFGASVSEQTRHHSTQEITGYITYLSEVITAGSDILISRVTSGSNTIDDAGIIYVHRVVELQPDICVLDWSTPANNDCDFSSIKFIYSELLSHKIIPLTVIFPRSDRDQSVTPITIKLQKFCHTYLLPFIDLNQLINKSDLSLILRDTVHTNREGAKKYANLLIDRIKEAKVTEDTFDTFSSQEKLFFVRKILPKGNIKNKVKQITINIESANKNGKVKFFLEQRVGPWSTFVDVYKIEENNTNMLIQTVTLYDPWCWRERQCLKEVTDFISLPVKIIKLCQSNKLPNYSFQTQEKCDFDSYPKHIRPKGSLFMLSTSKHVNASVIY
jgi:hypothetical protein